MLEETPPLPSQRASGLGCTPSEKRSRAKLLETEGILPLSLHHLGDFLFDFYFASWSKEEGGDPARPLSFPPLLCIFFPSLFFFFCSEDRRLWGDAFGHGVCVGLGGSIGMERFHAGEVPGWDFFFFSLYPEMYREQQASLRNEHGDLVEATAAWLGTQKNPERRGRWGLRTSA